MHELSSALVSLSIFFLSSVLSTSSFRQLLRNVSSCMALYQNFTRPVAFAIFQNLPTSIMVLCMSLASSCAYCLFHILLASAPLRSILCFLTLLVSENSLFSWLRLELFTILPLFHQTVKAGCILQTCMFLFLVALSLLSLPPETLRPTLLLLLPTRPLSHCHA